MSEPGVDERPNEANHSDRPIYKGAPLDAELGPGLGCFWIQVVTLVVLLVLTPLSVIWAWDSRVSAALLIASLAILFFVGQTTIFLLRLVAADRRAARRAPRSASARKTVGMLEDEAAASRANKVSDEDDPRTG